VLGWLEGAVSDPSDLPSLPKIKAALAERRKH
jgi:hypothetical protein